MDTWESIKAEFDSAMELHKTNMKEGNERLGLVYKRAKALAGRDKGITQSLESFIKEGLGNK